MRPPLNGFNGVARYYDTLKNMVFGKAIHESQISFLTAVPSGAKVLILGGGSGEILPVLSKMNPAADIWFVEASSEMLRLAARRVYAKAGGRVRFIHGTENDLPAEVVFDAVITHFFLDLFPDQKLMRLCMGIRKRLHPGGLWLVSDFVEGRQTWQRILLWLMYRFFSLTSRVEAGRLPDWMGHLQANGMEEVSSRVFYRGFIHSGLYKKS